MVYGELIDRVGSNDEISTVMWHQMAQAGLKHKEKAQQNTGVGMGIRRLVTGVIAASAGPCYTAQCRSARTDLRKGVQAGAVAGGIRYSPGMELEANQLGRYIVRKAGYNLRAVRKLFMRMARGEADGSPGSS